jgi:hypothetical protein
MGNGLAGITSSLEVAGQIHPVMLIEAKVVAEKLTD